MITKIITMGGYQKMTCQYEIDNKKVSTFLFVFAQEG